MDAPIRIALVGVGKIARDRHIPSIAGTDGITLVAACSRHATVEGVPNFPSLDALLASGVAVDAVALCTPPPARHALARAALSAGKHVLLEKPPGATVSELMPLVALAGERRLALLATWHSRYGAAVAPARDRLREAAIRSVRIDWREDVRHWHPGQAWIWEPGGLGVFDPGINALSILTAILPWPVFLTGSTLFVPENRAQPIAADLTFSSPGGIPVTAGFDWRQTGTQTWDIRVETDGGTLTVAAGGSRLLLDGVLLAEGPDREYPALYARFVDLVRRGAVDVDAAPLAHVADAFLLGRTVAVEAFHDDI